MTTTALELTPLWGKVFPQGGKVDHGKVAFLIVVPGASHTDLHDQVGIIPFDTTQEFFEKNLNA